MIERELTVQWWFGWICLRYDIMVRCLELREVYKSAVYFPSFQWAEKQARARRWRFGGSSTLFAAEKTSISCQTCNWHSHVSVNREDLLLSRQFWCSHNHSESLAIKTDSCWSLFDSLHGILHLMDSALWAPDSHIVILLVAKLWIVELTKYKFKA